MKTAPLHPPPRGGICRNSALTLCRSLLSPAWILAGLALSTFASGPLRGQASLGNGASVEILGVGTEFLLGGDLTDPENDGDELAGETDPSWNWKSIT